MVAIAAVGAPAAAQASPIDVRGTYEAAACVGGTLAECEAHPQFPQKYVLETEDVTTGALTGKGFSDACSPIYSITGTIAGSTVKLHTEQPGYTSDAVLTVNPQGTKLSGTFSDSFERVNQPSFGNRIAGFPCGGGTRPTATSVICNYEFATSQNTCGAVVGDGGEGTPVTPTGTVSFTTTTGGFANGASCTLTPTPLSPQTASCTIVYQTANSGLPAITATYGGDARHAGSVGHTQFLGTEIGSSTFEAPTGPSGQYPNELKLGIEVPASGTTIEAAAQGANPNPAPVPMNLLKPGAGLDALSVTDLSLIDKVAVEVDATGAQNSTLISELNRNVEKALEHVAELNKSTNPGDQAAAKLMLEDTLRTIETINTMLRAAEKAQNEINRYPHSAAFSAARRKATKQRIKAVRALGYIVRRAVPAGKLELSLPINRAALNKLAGKRNSVTVVVRLDMLLPSKVVPGGVPRVLVERITLKRTPPAHRHRKR